MEWDGMGRAGDEKRECVRDRRVVVAGNENGSVRK